MEVATWRPLPGRWFSREQTQCRARPTGKRNRAGNRVSKTILTLPRVFLNRRRGAGSDHVAS